MVAVTSMGPFSLPVDPRGLPSSVKQPLPPQLSRLSPTFCSPLHPHSPCLLCCSETDCIVIASHPSGYKGRRLPAGQQNPTGTEGRWLQGPGGPAVCSPPLTVSTRLHPISAPSNGCPPKPGFSFLSFFFPSLQSGGASCWLSGENSKGTTFQGA